MYWDENIRNIQSCEMETWNDIRVSGIILLKDYGLLTTAEEKSVKE